MMSYFKPYMYVSLYENRHTIRRERLTLDRVLYPVWAMKRLEAAMQQEI